MSSFSKSVSIFTPHCVCALTIHELKFSHSLLSALCSLLSSFRTGYPAIRERQGRSGLGRAAKGDQH